MCAREGGAAFDGAGVAEVNFEKNSSFIQGRGWAAGHVNVIRGLAVCVEIRLSHTIRPVGLALLPWAENLTCHGTAREQGQSYG